LRHGGGQERVDYNELNIASASDDDRVLMVNDALDLFAGEDSTKAQFVKLRFFGGLSLEEAAQASAISETTAKRWWAFSRARLYELIAKGGGPFCGKNPH
jgi:DNA-directed RNA polymerase specialized sigma24 family protein